MRRYESVLILDPELSDEDVQSFTDRYSGLIKEGGGEIIRVEDWGQKRLAYLVKKKDTGRYLLLDYVGMPSVLNEVERQFKISEHVMKFLSIMLDDNVDLDAFKEQAPQEETVATPPEPAATEPAPPVTEPEAQPTETAPAEAAAEAPSTPEPVAEAPAEPVVEATAEPVVEAPAEPVAEAPAEAPEEAPAEAPEEAAVKTPVESAPEPPAAEAEPTAETSDEPASDEIKKEGDN